MSKFKAALAGIGIILAIIVLAFTLELGGLQWDMFFKPRHANVERKTYEQSQSYVQGMTKELAKHFDEYQNADAADRIIIEQTIKHSFADFDETTIRSAGLRNFLIQTRGY
jgi:hypothetical protein